ncbi:hypothetical protein Csa_020890 [Cucumis sativus]|uniref:Uncharacterized protein n=1 Tax=Cucumis sativus TaxID=3659 RepID=A0A0A0KG60_CUCSA|nr:hypothetical protein Csa_020890 [Cucumis sativus]
MEMAMELDDSFSNVLLPFSLVSFTEDGRTPRFLINPLRTVVSLRNPPSPLVELKRRTALVSLPSFVEAYYGILLSSSALF